MSRYELRPDEVTALRAVLAAIVVSEPSGEIGVIHGNGRFVTSRHGMSAESRKAIDGLARKLGQGSGVARVRS